MFAGHLRTPVISEVLSSLALLRSQLSANGPENIFVTFVQRSASKSEFRNYLIYLYSCTVWNRTIVFFLRGRRLTIRPLCRPGRNHCFFLLAGEYLKYRPPASLVYQLSVKPSICVFFYNICKIPGSSIRIFFQQIVAMTDFQPLFFL